MVEVLVIGSGGREHALAWKLAQSPEVSHVYVAPGNSGTAREPKVSNVAIAGTNVAALAAFAKERGIALTVVGPEAPLVAGIVDRFEAEGLPVFGPRQNAAELEGSKAFAKDFLARHRIPTAHYQVFTDADAARAYVRERGAPIVVKADGLAAGKGVVVAQSVAEAEAAIADMLEHGSFGGAGARVVIEDFLEGEEASYIVVAAGEHYIPLASSQDHKRLLDGDQGPNTGGMGAYSPAPIVTPEVDARVRRDIIEPTLRGMIADGRPFTGFLYAGLMIDRHGHPHTVEFNVRFGDPETQPIMLRLRSDLYTLLQAARAGTLAHEAVAWDPRAAIGVVLAAQGYPQAPRHGDPIEDRGLDTADTKVFHAGAKLEGEVVRSDGGRVLTVCALADDLRAAREQAYARLESISLQGGQYRTDIGFRAFETKDRQNES